MQLTGPTTQMRESISMPKSSSSKTIAPRGRVRGGDVRPPRPWRSLVRSDGPCYSPPTPPTSRGPPTSAGRAGASAAERRPRDRASAGRPGRPSSCREARPAPPPPDQVASTNTTPLRRKGPTDTHFRLARPRDSAALSSDMGSWPVDSNRGSRFRV